MGKLTFAFGTLILISGFVIYQLGFSITFHQALLSPLASIFPEPYLDLIGVALKFGGGILGIIGFLICISNAISTQRKITLREISKLRATPPAEKTTIHTHPCKFCGAQIDKRTNFCPACNRSQR